MPKSMSNRESARLRKKRTKMLHSTDQDDLNFKASRPGKPKHEEDKAFHEAYEKLAGAPGAYTEARHGRIKNSKKKYP